MNTSLGRSLRIYQECPVCKKQIKGVRFKKHVLKHWIASKKYEEFPDFIRRVYESKVKIPFRLLNRRPRYLPTVGKRKTAIAKAITTSGVGRIKINNVPIEIWQPKLARAKIKEPLLLAEGEVKTIDIEVSVKGGGFMGQAEAVRTAIAKGIVGWTRNPAIKKKIMEYDRSLLVSDPRRKEPKKFRRKGARARRQKSYR